MTISVRTGRKRWTRIFESGWTWIVLALLVIVFVKLVPIAYAVWLSMFDLRGFQPVGEFVGIANYLQQLGNPDFWRAVRVGTIFTFSSTLFQLVVGLGVALLLHRTFRGRGLVRALAVLPYMIPTVTTALMFGLMTNNVYGIVNQVLVDLGVIESPILFFGNETWALPAAILVSIWQWSPFMMIMILARLQSIDGALYESASVEGARPLRQFFDITLPSLRGTILLLFLLRSIWMFNKFDIPYLLTQGGPFGSTTNLPIYAYQVNFQQLQRGDGAALAIIMSLLLLSFAVPYFRALKPEREMETD